MNDERKRSRNDRYRIAGAAVLLGFGAWGLLGPGSPAAAGAYGMMTTVCDPFEESVAAEPAADTDWGMMDGFGMMGSYAGEDVNLSDEAANPSVSDSNSWWIPCAEPGSGPVDGLAAVVRVAERYIGSSGNPNLVLGEVMEFSNNYYAVAVEKDTGIGAFEFLIDPSTGAIAPEPGPNMMWNTKYGTVSDFGGMPGSMMNETRQGVAMPVSVDQARGDAQQYLSESMPGTSISSEADRFYGYYTFHVLQGQGGPILGMLSVNGTTGAVWYHNWHGPFIAMEDTTASQ